MHEMQSLELHCETLENQDEELSEKIKLVERKVIVKTQQKAEALADNISVVLERR